MYIYIYIQCNIWSYQVTQQSRDLSRPAPAPALREVRLNKETDETKIGAVFHRSDDAFDKVHANLSICLNTYLIYLSV